MSRSEYIRWFGEIHLTDTPQVGGKNASLGAMYRELRGLEVYVMCAIPSNVIVTAHFAQLFDGFSIGSNDLTQLTRGLDPDAVIATTGEVVAMERVLAEEGGAP